MVVVLTDKAFKYGDSRLSLRVPKELDDEIKVGDKCEIYVDRASKAIVYLFPDSEIAEKKIILGEKVVESIIEKGE